MENITGVGKIELKRTKSERAEAMMIYQSSTASKKKFVGKRRLVHSGKKMVV